MIPVLDEAENLRPLFEHLRQVPDIHWILFVVDRSEDGTEEVLEELRMQDERVHIYRHPTPEGLGMALRDGLAYALENFPFDRLVQMDGDLSHDPAAIPDMLGAEADLVLGSRYMAGGKIATWPLSRRLISWTANAVARLSLALSAHDLTTGFRVCSRALSGELARRAECGGYEFQVEGVYWAKRLNFSIREVPITFRDRIDGQSKLAKPHEIYRFVRFVVRETLKRMVGRTAIN